MRGLKLLIIVAVAAALAGCGKSTDQGHMSHGSEHSDTATANTEAVWTLSTDHPSPNTDITIKVKIRDGSGKPVEQFDINHEKKMHLIIMSKDLSYFGHLHPEYEENGEFTVTTQLPSAGEFKMYADYIPAGGTETTKSNWVTVQGTAPAPASITPDLDKEKVIDGKKITLEFDQIQANKELNLTFNIVDAKTNLPITDLQPYLGAVGHVVIVSEDTENYLHVHPTEENATGPDAKFMTSFPASGKYKIWGQFKQNGKTFIVPFVVNIP
ncbi:hypothetical protein [Paenibacillus sp. MMS18-CY102]|uniref:hypothetical protein n=1 Tax=Paenibacillus sp. MMS18-CY102 TaxID=2682849 RepID=UPI001366116C|nr:hypothetical protein [Paenibacillus sp. MMS18-CY102]MWC29909.1 hypothetical protein [Paenibacillus sp. MMS18-CY102]